MESTIYRPEYRSGRYSQGGTTREQRCSDLAMTGGAERRTEGAVKSHCKSHIPGGVDNIAAYIEVSLDGFATAHRLRRLALQADSRIIFLALGDKSGECHGRKSVRSSVHYRVGGRR